MNKKTYPPISVEEFEHVLGSVTFNVSQLVGSSGNPEGRPFRGHLLWMLGKTGVNRAVAELMIEFLVNAEMLVVEGGRFRYGPNAFEPGHTWNRYSDPTILQERGMAVFAGLSEEDRQRILQKIGNAAKGAIGTKRAPVTVKKPRSASAKSPSSGRSSGGKGANAHLAVYIDPGDAPTDAIVELFAALSAMHQAHGGAPLVFVRDGYGTVAARSAVR
jgi:hypothetical protein